MRRLPLAITVLAVPLLTLLAASPALAEMATVPLAIQNHRFVPTEITIPANTKVRLLISNRDPSAEEFESDDLRREKVIPGNSQGVVFVGPLPAGTYGFFGDFHRATAQGRLLVR